MGRGSLGFLIVRAKGAQSSRKDLDFKSRRRGGCGSGKGRGCFKCRQGGVEAVGFEEVEVPCLLVACICKRVADPICVMQGYAKEFGGLFEIFLGLDQVLYMFEYSLIFDDGPGIDFPYKGKNWIMLDGGGESIKLFVGDHGMNSSFRPDEGVGTSGGCIAFWYQGIWVVRRGVDVIGDVRQVLHL